MGKLNGDEDLGVAMDDESTDDEDLEDDSTYYQDLSRCDYFEDDLPNTALTAVGWLSLTRPYKNGPTNNLFRDRLFHLLLDPWETGMFLGFQACPFCGFFGEVGKDYQQITVGSSNLFVPSDGGLFVCPSLIYHYVTAHDYCPPDSFQAAVLNCPQMGSPAYLDSLRNFNVPAEYL